MNNCSSLQNDDDNTNNKISIFVCFNSTEAQAKINGKANGAKADSSKLKHLRLTKRL